MADKQIKTTSSSTLDGDNDRKSITPINAERSGHRNTQILTKLASSLSESYQLVKQRQQKYHELSAKMSTANTPQLISYTQHTTRDSLETVDSGGGEWQEVTNKLKRKKKLSASLTSVNDSVNQEKRTRIEGIQLNCRGKLHITEMPANVAQQPIRRELQPMPLKAEKGVMQKPPAVPVVVKQVPSAGGGATPTVPPPRLKRKLQENVQTIQKLNALTEQLRLEINELKSSLTTERGAVRVLRAQNESETRKWKNEVKKLQNALELTKKNQTAASAPLSGAKKENCGGENVPTAGSVGAVVANYEIQRLTNEIIALKEANKALEERKMINCDADRRKAADMRTLKDSYEIRLTQLTKSAKTEISRLLEEIKTKERNIGQLKRELQIQQTKPQQKQQNEAKQQSRNATTNQTNKNKTTIKPKKNSTKNTNTTKKQTKNDNNKNNDKNDEKTAKVNEKKTEEEQNQQEQQMQVTNEVQHPDEVKKLKDIELINNTKNLQNNLKTNIPTTVTTTTNILHTTTTTPTTNASATLANNANTKILTNHNLTLLKPLENVQIDNANNLRGHEQNCNNLLTTTTTQAFGQSPKIREYQKEEEEEHLMGSELANMGTATKIETQTKQHQHQQQQQHEHQNDANEYRAKDNNSDSDSALSSAPPSISPQPPPAGLDTADIWQMIRTSSADLEKLQKHNEILQKENEHLHAELNMAKEQILENEKVTMETTDQSKLHHLMERVKLLEEQEHQLRNEADELREQNELLEFRILELEETHDKWSLQSHAAPSSASTTSNTNTMATAKDVWACGKTNRDDPMQMLFGNSSSINDSGITSPHSQQHMEEDLHLVDSTNDEVRRRLSNMLQKSALDDEDKHCLQQLLQLLQQLEIFAQRSGPNSLNTNSCSSDDASSLDLVKSRISDYSSASSSSSARSTHDSTYTHPPSKASPTKTTAVVSPTALAPKSDRIVATVSPYNSAPSLAQQQQQQQNTQYQPVPTNTPTDSPRKSRQNWQSNSLSESGVFVESDFLSDASEHNACTQTDFEEFGGDLQRSQRYDILSKSLNRVPAYPPAPLHANTLGQFSPNLSDQKRLQYYKERLALLESKVLIYESSGDLQAKRLADRLQREIQLEKQLKELQDRVEFLETENATLEEEKCEFEEAENDTRLRLQRLEIELEILSQRNVELEVSREALSAKYKDCRSECLILRDDLSASETQIRHLEEDKQKAKENLELLHRLLPLLILYSTSQAVEQLLQAQNIAISPLALPTTTTSADETKMGNNLPTPCECLAEMMPASVRRNSFERANPMSQITNNETAFGNTAGGLNRQNNNTTFGGSGAYGRTNMTSTNTKPCCMTQAADNCSLQEEVSQLRQQMKELNCRHYEAMESADSHWLEMEREYKNREEAFRAKELCLKAKIQKLQDCLCDDTRAANEKIMQLEESERELKNCLVRISKEHRDICQDYECLNKELDAFKENYEKLKTCQSPLLESVDQEKKRCKSLCDEVNFLRKLQSETESRSQCEIQQLRAQITELRKDYLHIEVTNGELKEEVATLEKTIKTMQCNEKEMIDRMCVLQDEVRTKEEMVQKLEKRLERSEGYSLAQELGGSPSKRPKREDINDLKTANNGLAQALRSCTESDLKLPAQQQFRQIAKEVKRLADTILYGDEEVSIDEKKPTDIDEMCANRGEGDAAPSEKDGADDVDLAIVEQPNETTEANLDETADAEDAEVKTEPAEDENEVTVGMALIPPLIMQDTDMWAPGSPASTFVFKEIKPICEVPSEMRKLSVFPQQIVLPESKKQRKIVKRRTLRCRNNKRRSCRVAEMLPQCLRTMSSFPNTRRSPRFKDVDDNDTSTCHSEILHLNISYTSFQSVPDNSSLSVCAESMEVLQKVNAFTETEMGKIDKFTETVESGQESAVQVNDDMNPEKLLDILPPQTRSFLRMLKSCVSHMKLNTLKCNKDIMERWELDHNFREGLEMLRHLTLFNENCEYNVMDNYENFVNAMSCLHVLEEIFYPIKVPIMQQIEEKINEQLMIFHSRKMESEFYCTIYYPISRKKASDIELLH